MSNFYDTNNNIEQLLASEAEKYRMYPSDKVWNNIRKETQEKKRWPALMFGFVFITVALTITTLVFYPPHKDFVDNNKANTNKTKEAVVSKQTIDNNKNYVELNNINNTKSANASIVNNYSGFVHNVVNSNEPVQITASKEFEKNDVTSINEKSTLADIVTENKNSLIINNNTSSKNINDVESTTTTATNILQSNAPLAAKSSDATTYLNEFKKTALKSKVKSKWQLQAYVTPSVSYRVLEDDKSRASYTSNQTDLDALKSNVNDVVHHKAAFGSEFGIAAMYPLTKNLFVTTGLQFNTRQYIVDASVQSGQANISYVENSKLNTVSYKANYSTTPSFNNVKLDNKIYQLSIPIGLQWNFIDDARWGLALGATIQPTMTLNKSIYVVSTDYKYYTDGTPFFRKWNINTSTELLLTLKSGKNKWLIGPQIRYQKLPTYNDLYPIKEYRVDYGIKVGFMKSL